jgi:hypothetical protein
LSYGTLTAIAPSYNNLEVIYTGSDDGNVHVTFDGGTTWNDRSNGLPDRYITSIAISPSDDLTAYVTLSGFGLLDYDPHVFKTTDGGMNWTDISSNLPSIPANDIIINSAEDVLFLATDMNVWYSQNDGASWDILGNNLPFNIMRDLKLHEPTQTLFVGTFGRSMHSYDVSNIVLETQDVGLAANAITIYPNPATTQFTLEHRLTSEGSITLYDGTGKLLKTLFNGDFSTQTKLRFSSEGIAAGLYFVTVQVGTTAVTKQLIVQ